MNKIVLCVAIAAVSSFALAETGSREPASVNLGAGFTATPTLKLIQTYDDNIRETNEADSTWITSIVPGVLIEGLDGLNVYQLEYSARQDIFQTNGGDDNLDHHVRGMAHFDITKRNRLTFNGRYDRTETLTDTTVIGENDQFNETYVDAIYGIGVPTAMINADLSVNHLKKRTDNSGNINADREYDKSGFNGIVYLNYSPRTSALLEYRHDEYDYKLAGSQLDNTRERVFAGMRWAATAKTVGDIRVGYEERDFDDSRMKDADGVSWEAGITWKPRTYSTISLDTSKGFEEGRVFSNYVDTTRYAINWNHQWNQRISSDVFYNFTNEEFKGTNTRDDDINEMGFNVRYNVQRWMTVGAGYRYKDRESNLAERSYDRNLYVLSLDLSL